MTVVNFKVVYIIFSLVFIFAFFMLLSIEPASALLDATSGVIGKSSLSYVKTVSGPNITISFIP